ncbi:hypothetical protein CNYM01_01659 [Colletotrichum nymphaeae SA-01]|uniref:Heterokaryon incompatibility domain-containing protein n=1 Tax=Colletotrichum nymphaeae SA-01 TaxID=1460502 RepID=A0A135TWS1_9PEZI|nr:hypothetical protein CNYM01_01659 [Colletotrichum nymphaeae SA-01]
MCDSKIILGTHNLRSALRYLRFRSQVHSDSKNENIHFEDSNAKDEIHHFETSKFFWIDAICIDQDDVEEKQQQIPLMDRIYRTAESCLVWLGEADQWSSAALNLLFKIAMTEELVKAHERNLSERLRGSCWWNTKRLRILHDTRERGMWPRSRDGKLAFFGVRLLSPGRHATILHDHVYGILGLAAEFQCEPRGGQKPFLVDYIFTFSSCYIGNPNDVVLGGYHKTSQANTEYILQLLEFVIGIELDAQVLSNGQTPVPHVTGLFFTIFLAHTFHLSHNIPTPQTDGKCELDRNLIRYLQLINRLLELEPASRPFLPDPSKLLRAYYEISSKFRSMKQRQEAFVSVCAWQSIQDLMARAQETGLTFEVMGLVGDKPDEESIKAIIFGEFAMAKNLRNCIGSKTRRVCIGPKSSRYNDEIWMLHGLMLPAILRPLKDDPDKFQFIGNATVFGIEADIIGMGEEFAAMGMSTIPANFCWRWDVTVC